MSTRGDDFRKTGSITDTLKRPIVFDGTANPVKSALFFIICAAWLLPGLIGHDPWKPDEAQAFGVVLSMLHEGHWLAPMIAGLPATDYPPLYHWVAAFTAWLFSFALPLHDGARLASGVFMAITLYFTHKTAKRLFDERAGRIAVLLLIGCLGLQERAHEMNPEIAGLAGLAIAIYGMTRIRSEPAKGGRITGLGATVIALSVGVIPALFVPAILLALMLFQRDWSNRVFRRGILISIAILLTGMAIYPLALWIQGPISEAMWVDGILAAPFLIEAGRHAIEPAYFVRTLPWYGLPVLPFALWLWWQDREKLRARIELSLPLVCFVVLLVCIALLREARSPFFLMLLLPLTLAAASSLDRLPRGLANFIDGFSLFLFGLCMIGFWLYWTAAITGVPEAAAGAVARQTPGFTLPFHLAAFLFAAAITLVWLYAMIRAHRNNRRAIVNWAAGLTLVWGLLNLLALPAFDYARSYRSVAAELAAQLPKDSGCVAAQELGNPERASLDYFANLRFVSINIAERTDCKWLLTQGSKDRLPYVNGNWQQVWEGSRPNNAERFRLYKYQETTEP